MTEPHERGAILVSAVFAAFLTIYQSRCADLIRLATNGSGILPGGEISIDLANVVEGDDLDLLAEEPARGVDLIGEILVRLRPTSPIEAPAPERGSIYPILIVSSASAGAAKSANASAKPVASNRIVSSLGRLCCSLAVFVGLMIGRPPQFRPA